MTNISPKHPVLLAANPTWLDNRKVRRILQRAGLEIRRQSIFNLKVLCLPRERKGATIKRHAAFIYPEKCGFQAYSGVGVRFIAAARVNFFQKLF